MVTPVDAGVPSPTTGPVEDALETPFAEHEHEVGSLRVLFRERRLSIATMDRQLRLATGLALGGLIGVVLLIVLRDVGTSTTVVGGSNGVLVSLGTPLFIATLALLSIGFAYLLTGAVLASWPVAVVSLVLITGAIGVEAGAFGRLFGVAGFLSILPDWARWTTRVCSRPSGWLPP